jgi:methyl-accepting chemotaxis protein/methyl-accepting chemotaxis protein-1 (serine sensor receptor)
LYSIRSLGIELRTATDVTAQKVFLITELEGQLFRMRSCQRGVMLFSLYHLPGKVIGNKQELETRAAGVQSILTELKPMLITPKGRRDAAFVEAELVKFRGYFDEVARAAVAGDAQRTLAIYDNNSNPSLDAMDEASHDLVEIQKGLIQQSSEAGTRVFSRAHYLAYSLVLVALAILPLAVRTLMRATQALRGVAAHLHSGAEQINGAAAQVASSSQTLAQGASQQAAALQETAASSEEITSMTRKNAENSKAAAALMVEVEERVTAGNRTLQEMVQSMQEITGSSNKISKIIKVIDEIAFQTNILALNAAVEAARAGEAGMGFAVVADEVRNLAQRSAQAAKDTAGLIEESITKSNQGSQRLQQVAEVIRAITESAARVKTLVDEVDLGSQEQARGIEHISKSVSEMDRVTQGNAASAEQSAAASQQMSSQAEALQNVALELRTLVGGHEEMVSVTEIGPGSPSRRRSAH